MDKKRIINKFGWPIMIIGSAVSAVLIYFIMQIVISFLPFLTVNRDTVSVEMGALFGIIAYIAISIWEIRNS